MCGPIYDSKRERLKEELAKEDIAVVLDKMSDDLGQYVLNILATPLKLNAEGRLDAKLLGTIFLTKTNHSTVAQAVVQTLTAYQVDFNRVICFDTGNAAYMKKAFRERF